jgi:hypothetical protein
MKDFAQGRALVAAGVEADPGRLADPGVPLRDLAIPGRQPAPAT